MRLLVALMITGFGFRRYGGHDGRTPCGGAARAFFVRMTVLNSADGRRTYQRQSSGRVPADELCPAARRGE